MGLNDLRQKKAADYAMRRAYGNGATPYVMQPTAPAAPLTMNSQGGYGRPYDTRAAAVSVQAPVGAMGSDALNGAGANDAIVGPAMRPSGFGAYPNVAPQPDRRNAPKFRYGFMGG
jgi:hypothetical protein